MAAIAVRSECPILPRIITTNGLTTLVMTPIVSPLQLLEVETTIAIDCPSRFYNIFITGEYLFSLVRIPDQGEQPFWSKVTNRSGAWLPEITGRW